MLQEPKRSAQQPVRRLVVIGCGPHFIDRYSDVLAKQRSDVEIAAVVDLADRKEVVIQAMSAKGLAPETFIFLDEVHRNFPSLDIIRSRLNGVRQLWDVDAALICTEPKAHLSYAFWSLERGMNVFMDKPITPLTGDRPIDLLQREFLQLLKAKQNAGVRFVISCERRMQAGYLYVEEFLTRFMRQFCVPITHVSIHFAGGKWILPYELADLENHPFKYGYGVLFHSGYHYIDLLARLARFNTFIHEMNMADPVLDLAVVRHIDLNQVIESKLLQRFGISENCGDNVIPPGCGELDVSVLGRYEYKGRYRMNFDLQMLETSVSARNVRSERPGTGRIRQETVHVHLGNLCSIRIASDSFRKLLGSDEPEAFEISIACNPLVAEGVSVQRIDRTGLSGFEPRLPVGASLNGFARCDQLLDFLEGGDARSPLASHAESIALLTQICRVMRAQRPARR